MHDGFRQHLQLEELANEFYIPDGSPSGFVLGLFQLVVEPRLLLWLQNRKTALKNHVHRAQTSSKDPFYA